MDVRFLDNYEINIIIKDDKYSVEAAKDLKNITPDVDFNIFSSVNNHELFMEIMIRKIIADLYKEHKQKIEPDTTYHVNINLGGEVIRYTIRNITKENKVNLKGIVYGMAMY
jgi:hypothetical protein